MDLFEMRIKQKVNSSLSKQWEKLYNYYKCLHIVEKCVHFDRDLGFEFQNRLSSVTFNLKTLQITIFGNEK